MQIVKVLNNSSAIVIDGDQESIVMGNGLAFGKTNGDLIEEAKVERQFFATPNFSNEKLQELFERLSYQDSALAFDIIEHFKAQLPYSLNDMIYLVLSDHISFSIQRAKDGIYVPNAVLNEVQIFYPEEYLLGLWAVEQINAHAGVHLQEDEAGFIALHIVNSRWQSEETKTEQDFSKIIKDLVIILNETYDCDFAEDPVNYHRLVTHLKYFLFREFGMQSVHTDDFGYFDQIILEFPAAYHGAEKIEQYFQTFFHRRLPKEEKVFLTIHINRILQN